MSRNRIREAPKTVTSTIPEKALQRAVLELAMTVGYRVHHCRTAPTRSGGHATPIEGHRGFPDLVLVGHDRVIFAELKSAKGRMSEDQMVWRTRIEDVGAEYFLWRPADWLDGTIERELRG